MSQDQYAQEAALLTAWAQETTPASGLPVFASLPEWVAWNAHTMAGEAVCHAGEWAMRPATRRLARRVARAVTATARSLWRTLPGPWPVKAVIVVLCFAIPGPFDELVVLGLVAVLAARKAARR